LEGKGPRSPHEKKVPYNFLEGRHRNPPRKREGGSLVTREMRTSSGKKVSNPSGGSAALTRNLAPGERERKFTGGKGNYPLPTQQNPGEGRKCFEEAITRPLEGPAFLGAGLGPR